jgi:uncharacterized membrane protein YkvA (DUF1232 family)|tara:strand:+ start:68 stop:499 length:432 start_codon:yes stop_codon:yes gene_type:complete
MVKPNLLNHEFYEILDLSVGNYKGKHSIIIKLAPVIYKTMCNLLNSIALDQNHRNDLFVAIGYFVIPKDLYSESIFGPIGYIDDILLSIYVLRKIKEKYGIEEVYEYWDGDYNVLEKLLSSDFKKLKKEYLELFNSMLKFCGL